MRGSHTIKPMWALVALILTFAFGFDGYGLRPAHAEPDGKQLFEAQCAQCHGPKEVIDWGRSRPDAEARAKWLDRFLLRHYPPAENERPAIIRHIQDRIAENSGKK